MKRNACSLLALVVLAVGCSSSDDPETAPVDSGSPVDSSVDSKPIDTGPKDTGTPDTKDSGPAAPACSTDLPSDFVCKAATSTKPLGATSCTEAALQAFAKACVTGDLKVPSTCAAWKAANPDCNTCVEKWVSTGFTGKVYPDRDRCYWAVFDDNCRMAANCYFECGRAVCESCDRTKGSGTTATKSEFDDCWDWTHGAGSASKLKGYCYDLASKKARAECFGSAFDLDPCIVNELFTPTGTGGKPDETLLRTQVVEYYRGACRDGADWTKATSAGDAGVTDTGPADTGPADTGPADTGPADTGPADTGPAD